MVSLRPRREAFALSDFAALRSAGRDPPPACGTDRMVRKLVSYSAVRVGVGSRSSFTKAINVALEARYSLQK